MSWLGKILGGSIGFALGGPLGAICGAAFGHHVIDKNTETYIIHEQTGYQNGVDAQLIFFVATFSMLAKLTKADGRVRQSEIDTIENFMQKDLGLNAQSRKVAINIFKSAQISNDSFEAFARQFYQKFYSQPQIIEFLIDILLRVGYADGTLSEPEERLILSGVKIFQMNEAHYQSLKAKHIRQTRSYYAILGCDETDTNEEIKKKYRLLVQEYHPDKIVSKGLPDEFVKFAQDKFMEIQDAYEGIKKERGF